MTERKLLKIIRPPGGGASMTIDGTEYRVVRIKVRGDLIEVLFEGEPCPCTHTPPAQNRSDR